MTVDMNEWMMNERIKCDRTNRVPLCYI